MSHSNNSKPFSFRVVAYCRVSSMDQVNGTLTIKGSLGEQEEKARAYAERAGWEFVETYIEPGVSGEKFEERLALQRMLEDARAGRFDCVIVKAGDRLARDQEVFFRITKILNHYYNIQILNLANPNQIVAPDSFIGRRNSQLIIHQGLDAMMAAYDQSRRNEMLEEGRRRQVRAGRFIQTHIFYGYQVEHRIIGGRKVDRIPIPEPSEYWVLELLPQLVLDENLSDREIAKRLNELGAKTRKGGPWVKSTVARMITHPFYAGKLPYSRQRVKVDEDGKSRPKKNPNPETIILAEHKYEHPWDWETFEKMQEKRKQRHETPAKLAVSRSPVAGLLVCGYCGHSMVLRLGSGQPGREVTGWATWKDGSRHQKTYVANTRRSDYFHCGYYNQTHSACQINRVPVKLVMEYLVTLFKELIEQKNADPDSFYANLQGSDHSERLAALDKRLKAAKAELLETIPAKIDRLNRGYLNGMVSEEQYPALTKIIDEDKDRLKHTILELEKELRKVEAASQKGENMRKFVNELEAMIERFKLPIGEWPDGEARKALAWLKSRYVKIAVNMEPYVDGSPPPGWGAGRPKPRKLKVSYELVPV